MFCRKCGMEIPDDSVFCTRCGTPVQVAPSSGPPIPAGEQIELFQDVVAKDHFDLHITATRLVLLKTQSAGGGAGSLLGPVGTLVEMGVNRAMRRKYDDDLTLDQKLRRDKSNLSIEYAMVDSVKLGKGKLGGRIMQVRYADAKGAFQKIDITVNDEQFQRLGRLIPSVPVLGSKLVTKP